MLSLFIVVGLLMFLYLGICWYLSSLILSPESSLALSKEKIKTEWETSYEAMIKLLPKPVDFTVNSFDGVPLKGKYFACEDSPKCVIIAAHGWTGTWIEMLKYVPVLADCSCDLVFFDHRGHGLSGKAYPTGGINESKDLLAITAWVQKTKGVEDHKIGWLGSSWGAATVLKAGATGKQVGFIIADAPFQDWYSAIFERAERDYGSWTKLVSIGMMKLVNWRTGIDYKKASPLNATKHITIPILLIHSQMDNSTNSTQSVNISKQLNAKSIFHHLTWGGDHTLDVVLYKDKFRKLINDFLRTFDKQYLGNQIKK